MGNQMVVRSSLAATRQVSSLPLFFAVLILSTGASASLKQLPFPVKVLSAESRRFEAPPLLPPNCNWKDISAYCYSSSPQTYIENTMVIQEPDGNSLEVACLVYGPWSHCADLPVNRTFQARLQKHGVEIRYLDQHHKMRKQVYEIVKANESGH
jgi:hypothetical protein